MLNNSQLGSNSVHEEVMLIQMAARVAPPNPDYFFGEF